MKHKEVKKIKWMLKWVKKRKRALIAKIYKGIVTNNYKPMNVETKQVDEWWIDQDGKIGKWLQREKS